MGSWVRIAVFGFVSLIMIFLAIFLSGVVEAVLFMFLPFLAGGIVGLIISAILVSIFAGMLLIRVASRFR